MSSAFLSAITSRRSIYQLGRKQILPDSKLVSLVTEIVKQTPSSFNSQSSRVLILLGDDHDKYWGTTVPSALRAVVKDDETYNKGAERIAGFRPAYGTVVFFEEEATVQEFQKNIPAYAASFPQWSTHGNAMAQINTWVALELENYGANLQHYINLTEGALKEQYKLPSTWKGHAELVFGSAEGKAGEKTFLPDSERVKVSGASN